MTQPVQEPSQGRVNQGLEFRTRQLFRRPTIASNAFAIYSGGAGSFAGTETGGTIYLPEDHAGWTGNLSTSDDNKITLTAGGRVRCSISSNEHYMFFCNVGGRYPSTAAQEFGLSSGLTTWSSVGTRDDYAQDVWAQSPAAYITRNHNQITATWLPVPDILHSQWFRHPINESSFDAGDWFDCLPNWTPQNTYGHVISADLLIMEVAPYTSFSFHTY